MILLPEVPPLLGDGLIGTESGIFPGHGQQERDILMSDVMLSRYFVQEVCLKGSPLYLPGSQNFLHVMPILCPLMWEPFSETAALRPFRK